MRKALVVSLVLCLPSVFPAQSQEPATGTDAARAPASDGYFAQGRVIESTGAVLAPRDRVEPENRMLQERLDTLLPRLMQESGLDMWLVIAREYAEDPVYFTLVPQPSHAARRTTMLIFHRQPDDRVQRLSINRYPFGDPYESAWSGGDLDAQWKALGELIVARDPQRIGINVSEQWPYAAFNAATTRNEHGLSFTRRWHTQGGNTMGNDRGDANAAREVAGIIREWAKAVARNDREAILARHSRDVLMFDFPAPPVRGIDAYARTWDFFFANPKGPIVFEPGELEVTAGDDVAFATCLMHCDGTSAGPLDFRLTVGLRKVDGEWTVLHEHHSVPSVEERFNPG